MESFISVCRWCSSQIEPEATVVIAKDKMRSAAMESSIGGRYSQAAMSFL